MSFLFLKGKKDRSHSTVLHSLPSMRPVNVTRIIRSGNNIIAVGKNEKLYTLFNSNTQSPYWLKDHCKFAWAYKCLVKLGILSKGPVDDLLEEASIELDISHNSYKVSSLKEYAEEVGIKFSNSQVAKMKAFANPKLKK